jgi:hypothetical protein
LSILSLSQVFSLFVWFPLVALLAIYLLIARFYQRFSGVKTRFWWYTLPMFFFGASSVRYASVDQLAQDTWGDAFLLLGGLNLLVLSTWLYWHMMNGGPS